MKTGRLNLAAWWALGCLAVLTAGACGPARTAAWETPPVPAPPPPLPEPAPPAWETLAARAEQAWCGREDRTELEKAIQLWNEALRFRPGAHDILTALAKAYFFLADGFLRDPANQGEMVQTFENGVLAAENAMLTASPEFARMMQEGAQIEVAVSAIPPEGQPAVYWYAANLGQFALTKGFAVVLFYKDRLFAVMQWVLSVDETVYYAAPHRFLGAFRSKSPNFAGGDLSKAKAHFERAIELFPGFFGTKVLYAEYYATAARDRALFVRLLGEVTAADPAMIPEIVAEQKLEQEKAKKLLAQVGQLF